MPRKLTERERFVKSEFLDYQENLLALAEEATNGVLYSQVGKEAYNSGRVTEWELIARPFHHIKRFASEELLTFFSQAGRLTFTEFRRQYSEGRT